MRLFVSVDLPPALTEGIAAVQELLEPASGLRFVDPGQAHVTMKFLGETPEARVETIVAALERAVDQADVEPFEATYEGLGVFPSLEYISVVWVGVSEGDGEFERLAAQIESALVAEGFEKADHEFTPHVTIARMDHAGGKEHVQQVVREETPVVGTATIEEVRLTESTLTDDGPVYETVRAIPLG